MKIYSGGNKVNKEWVYNELSKAVGVSISTAKRYTKHLNFDEFK
jgi:DNA-binding MurR/RpiR family transcriptional regulator